MRLFGSDRIAKMMDRLGLKEGEVIQHSMITSSIERAQKKVEENNFGIRKRLLEYDDVMNAQREVIYKRRKHALFGERLKLDIDNMFYDLAASTVDQNHAIKNYDGYKLDLLRHFGMEAAVSQEEFATAKTEDIIQRTYEAVETRYKNRIDEIKREAFPVIKNVHDNNTQGFTNIAIPFSDARKTVQVAVNLEKAYQSECAEIVDALEKGITLAMIDQSWKEHLRDMDDLRSNVQFASHEQKDPLLIYKLESYSLFKNLVSKVNSELTNFLMHARLPQGQQGQVQQAPAPKAPEAARVNVQKAESLNLQQRVAVSQQPSAQPQMQMPPQVPAPKAEPVKAEVRIGRNDPCPCGSGKKYKSCHGQEA
jgi:preprotein translocase subunit SecA